MPKLAFLCVFLLFSWTFSPCALTLSNSTETRGLVVEGARTLADISVLVQENEDLRDDKEGLEIEFEARVAESERKSASLQAENAGLHSELELLRNETEQLVSLLGNII